MKNSILVFALITILALFGCQNNDTMEVKNTVIRSYDAILKHDSLQTSTNYSNDLNNLISQANAKEQVEAERILQSDHPTDKAACIEGSVFTSLFEGHTGIKVDRITIDGNHATADISVSNEYYKEKWTDQVLLVKENTWKIDNILFKKQNATSKSTQELLKDFLK